MFKFYKKWREYPVFWVACILGSFSGVVYTAAKIADNGVWVIMTCVCILSAVGAASKLADTL